MTTICRSDLITRLSKLDAPDREVDAEIMSLFYVRGKRHIGAYMENDFGIDEPVDSDVWIDPKTDRWVSTSAHCFTASVEAAIALAERELPGWHWQVDKCGAVLRSGHALFSTDHSTPAIALCIALLRAKEASHAD
ncbi:hypothetical protein [Brucella oryzae]|uniref:Phage ABA sandwich domain-containing protein n=1 Tax=Brucella oryzae TaxID=335286 RepID=A0A2S7IUK0_9HYPH|nr:hypothetical protein [Brucella oryzae]PQA71600.1 hypothetical protein C3731_21150 [Brucella oryzae]